MASEYTLNISFTEEDLAHLAGSGRRVVIVKKTSDTNERLEAERENAKEGDSLLGVSWIVVKPEEDIQVSWEADYYIYASNTKYEKGAQIKTMAHVDAAPTNFKYVYQSSGLFKRENFSAGSEGTYYARNEWGDDRTFGLAQNVVVGGNTQSISPINAQSIFNDENVSFLPKEAVIVFVAKEDTSGKVISYVQSDTLTVDLTEKNVRSIKYDSDHSKFIPA